jgi:hypothetical protein
MDDGGDRLVYRKARWKAAALGIGGLVMVGMAVTVRLWVPTAFWPLVGLLFLTVGAACLFHAVRDGLGGDRLTITREGLERAGLGRPVRLRWEEIERIEVSFDSDGLASSLDVWTGGREPRLSTSGWTRTPARIKAEIEAARARWRAEA